MNASRYNRSKIGLVGAVAAAASLFAAPLALNVFAPQAAVAAAPAAVDPTGTYGVDKLHSDIGFSITHLAVSKVKGRFTDFDGTVVADSKKLANSSVSFTIQVASINTDNAQRDAHLKSPDFFDAEKYPTIAFKSTRITKKGKGFIADGILTIHGVSKPVSLPFTTIGPVKGPDGAYHLGIETSTTISRSAYGLTWSKLVEGTAMVGDDVAISINLDLVKK